jgi:hypothetical protein
MPQDYIFRKKVICVGVVNAVDRALESQMEGSGDQEFKSTLALGENEKQKLH